MSNRKAQPRCRVNVFEKQGLRAKKRGQNHSKMSLSHTGSMPVRISNHFVDELIEIGGFSKILDDILIT